MKDINEEVLKAWIRLTLTINKDRLVPDLTFNESVICRLLKESTKGFLTASELCESTGILKSQMNQILNKMIEKDLIIKERSSTDKREVLIYLKDVKSFDLQHDKIMAIVQKITSKLGDKRSMEVAELFNLVADVAAKEKL